MSWRDYWNSDTPIYVNERHRQLHYRRIATDLVALIDEICPQGKPVVLDYGCGVGTLSNCLQGLLPKAHLNGFDVSAESITTINCNLASRGLFTNDSAQLGAGYNVIILSNVLHHIDPPNRSGTIQELKARLCGDGLLIVFEHNPINPVTQWVVRNSPLDENAILLYRGEVLTLLSSIEMSVLRTSYLFFFPRVLSSMRFLEDHLQWCPLGAQYAVVARQGRC